MHPCYACTTPLLRLSSPVQAALPLYRPLPCPFPRPSPAQRQSPPQHAAQGGSAQPPTVLPWPRPWTELTGSGAPCGGKAPVRRRRCGGGDHRRKQRKHWNTGASGMCSCCPPQLTHPPQKPLTPSDAHHTPLTHSDSPHAPFKCPLHTPGPALTHPLAPCPALMTPKGLCPEISGVPRTCGAAPHLHHTALAPTPNRPGVRCQPHHQPRYALSLPPVTCRSSPSKRSGYPTTQKSHDSPCRLSTAPTPPS